MKPIPEPIINFLRSQSFVIVSSIDPNGFPHSSCKDIVKIEPQGKIYLIDVYQGLTIKNILLNPQVSISAVDEHKFMGFCLKGKAGMLEDKINQEMIKAWEDKITSRLAKRLLRNLTQDQGQRHHPEASLPHPKQLILLEVEEILDLAQHHLKKHAL
jgi:general stress protein 26